jgi:hypothetical protein
MFKQKIIRRITMNGSKGTEPDSSYSPLILDPSLTEARATVESAKISKSATIKAAELSADAAKQTAELAFKGTKYRSWATIGVAVIGLIGLALGAKEAREKQKTAEAQRATAIAEGKDWKRRANEAMEERDMAAAHVREFIKCSEYKNPLVLYPCLQLARSKVESDSVPPKPQQLA